MKKILKSIGLLVGLGFLIVIVIAALMPWMDRWGATDDEIAASLTGDELVPSPRISYTRAISINAAPEDVYPWVVQLGAEKGGMYSYEWFETNILRCELINADRIHPEWQNLKVGDPMKMCPGTSGPPPYEIAIIEPNRSIIMGHKENSDWIEIWQFHFIPQEDGTTRLVIRSRNAAEGWFWDVIRPGEFIMMRGMMFGVKERAEALAKAGGLPPSPPPASDSKTANWTEFGAEISLAYDPRLASQVEALTVPAVPMDDQMLFSAAHPAFAQFRFAEYQNERPFELPVYPFEVQIRVFQTADFPGFGDDSPQGFVAQQQALIALLENGLDPARCTAPLFDDPGLPFLPWVNMKQAFCAQPLLVEFSGGRGIRYLTYYSQGPNPVLDYQVFYTFQGITDDGQFYISALLPIETGVFPNEFSACSECNEAKSNPVAELNADLTKQLTELNAQSPEAFAPSLTVLDEIIRSIQIAQ
jgi:hypothetical protein